MVLLKREEMLETHIRQYYSLSRYSFEHTPCMVVPGYIPNVSADLVCLSGIWMAWGKVADI